MEAVILLLVAAYVAKIVIEDSSFALRGKPSPRQAARAARAARRGPAAARRGAARSYLSDVWADGWEAARAGHARRTAAKRTRGPKPHKPTGPARSYLRNVAHDRHAAMSRRWQAAWGRADARRARKHPDPASTAQRPSVAPLTVVPTTAAGVATTQRNDGPPETETTGPEDGAGDTTEERNDQDMSTNTSNGEVTGLRSAITYAQGLADEADQAVTALETLSASLTAGGTGQGTVGKFGTAGENLTAAAGELRSAATDLESQLGVTEAYEATPDAGEKAFVTGE